MKKSYLIQRLTRPADAGRMGDLVNAFSFGGGLVNGGLSKEAMTLIRGVFSFDYMGAAEFEWGAVPRALGAMTERPIVKFFFNEHGRDIYVIGALDDLPEIERRVRCWANGWSANAALKESTRLPDVLKAREPDDWQPCGWLELDNGFMFFTDREMWERTAALFDAEPAGAIAP
jgi:hypothetical protein